MSFSNKIIFFSMKINKCDYIYWKKIHSTPRSEGSRRLFPVPWGLDLNRRQSHFWRNSSQTFSYNLLSLFWSKINRIIGFDASAGFKLGSLEWKKLMLTSRTKRAILYWFIFCWKLNQKMAFMSQKGSNSDRYANHEKQMASFNIC